MPDVPVRPQTRLGGLLVSEEAIYGLILVAGMIIIASERADEAWDTVVTVAVTVIVFFAAHVYAGTVSRMAGGPGSSVRAALGGAIRHSRGLLIVAVLPVIFLVLGASGVITADHGIWFALVVTVLLLVIDGWLMTASRSPAFWARAGGAAISGAFGAVLILLKVVIHH